MAPQHPEWKNQAAYKAILEGDKDYLVICIPGASRSSSLEMSVPGATSGGLQGFYLKQITGDDGSGAMLGDFKAEAAGIGPALMWSRDLGKQNVIFIAKWLH